MRRYGPDYRYAAEYRGGRSRGFPGGDRFGRGRVRRDYGIDYGYRRGGFEGSDMGETDWGFGGGGGWRGSAGRFGGGGPWSAYGSGEMGVSLGNQGRGGPRRGIVRGRMMRYDIGYGLGNDREWY